jgi:hypothetical protein
LWPIQVAGAISKIDSALNRSQGFDLWPHQQNAFFNDNLKYSAAI